MDEGGKGEEMHPLVSLASSHIEDEDGPLPISSRMQQIRRLIAEATPFLRKRISLLLDLVNNDHTIVTQNSQTLLLIWTLGGRDDHFRDRSFPSFYLCCCCLWTRCFPSRFFRRLFHSSGSIYSCQACLRRTYRRRYRQIASNTVTNYSHVHGSLYESRSLERCHLSCLERSRSRQGS